MLTKTCIMLLIGGSIDIPYFFTSGPFGLVYPASASFPASDFSYSSLTCLETAWISTSTCFLTQTDHLWANGALNPEASCYHSALHPVPVNTKQLCRCKLFPCWFLCVCLKPRTLHCTFPRLLTVTVGFICRTFRDSKDNGWKLGKNRCRHCFYFIYFSVYDNYHFSAVLL